MWSLSEDIAYRVIDGEAFCLDVGSRKVHRLNEVGTLILQCLDGKMEESEVVAKLCEVYEVPKEVAERDMHSFLQELKERGVVKGGADVK